MYYVVQPKTHSNSYYYTKVTTCGRRARQLRARGHARGGRPPQPSPSGWCWRRQVPWQPRWPQCGGRRSCVATSARYSCTELPYTVESCVVGARTVGIPTSKWYFTQTYPGARQQPTRQAAILKILEYSCSSVNPIRADLAARPPLALGKQRCAGVRSRTPAAGGSGCSGWAAGLAALWLPGC